MGKLCDIFCVHLREIRPCYNGTGFYQKKYQFEEIVSYSIGIICWTGSPTTAGLGTRNDLM